MAYAGPRRALTPRMRDVASCLMRGLRNAAIGEELGLRPGTVAPLVWRTTRRLGARDRDEAGAIYARMVAGGGRTDDADAAVCLELLARSLDITESAIADVEARCAALRRALAYPRRVVEQRRRLAEDGPDALDRLA